MFQVELFFFSFKLRLSFKIDPFFKFRQGHFLALSERMG